MITDAKAAIMHAEEQELLKPVTVSEEDKQAFFSKKRRSAIGMFFGSLALLAAAVLIALLLIYVAHVIIFSIRIVIGLFLVLCFPIYSIVNIFSVNSAISKGDYGFYTGTVVGRTEKGYRIRGLEQGDIDFETDPKPDLLEGNPVVVARLKDEISLIPYKG